MVRFLLLGRFIFPSSIFEYQDLFSTDAPSALVNRLTDLSLEKGNLPFIYPIKDGACTVNLHYLSPLLYPFLRNPAGIHDLASDLGTNITKLASIEKMLNFGGITTKISLLLRKLGRTGISHPGTPLPKYDIVFAPPRK